MILPKHQICFMTCKGTCIKYKIKKPSASVDGRYESGQKRCSVCAVFVKWDGKRCPCCNFTLRTKPRNTKNRKQLQIIQMAKRI